MSDEQELILVANNGAKSGLKIAVGFARFRRGVRVAVRSNNDFLKIAIVNLENQYLRNGRQ